MLLFNDLCQQAVSNRKMILNSSGLQRRDFVAITDVCSAIAHIILLSKDALKTRLFNVGGSWAPTVWEAACLIRDRCEDMLGYFPVLTRQPAYYGEVKSTLDFRTDALRHTGFKSSANKIFEIDSLIKFYRDIYQINR
jgi:UDP-glucose 4-epimerase